MPVVGIICGHDDTPQTFDTCIECHRKRGQRNCHFPTFALKLMRDNGSRRVGAGYSATTLLACPRAVALLEKYDYYEELESGWNKIRGEMMHMVAESYPDDNLIQERRIRKVVNVDGEDFVVTGKADEIDDVFDLIMDYKFVGEIPTKPKADHEAQFNIYRWLCDGGTYVGTDESYVGEVVTKKIKGGGMHYLTLKKKKKRDGTYIRPWKKIPYDVWDYDEIQRFVEDRLRPLTVFHKSGILPQHAPFESGYWKCDCEKIEEQLKARGIDVQETHGVFPEE